MTTTDTARLPDTTNNDRLVREFGATIHAAGHIGVIADAVIDIATSAAWRDYALAGHRATWLVAEFDYFLIASGVHYRDMEAMLKWRPDAHQLAPLMDPQADPDKRRPLKVASAQWDPPMPGVTLISLAKDLGWGTERGRQRKPPVGRRARARAAGADRDAAVRAARRERLGPQRCAELEALGAQLAEQLTTDECRFLADVLNVAAGRADGGLHS